MFSGITKNGKEQKKIGMRTEQRKKYQRKFPSRSFLQYTCELIYIMEMEKCLVYF